MTKQPHPVDFFDFDRIKTAVYYNVHIRRGPAVKFNYKAANLKEAAMISAKLAELHGKPAMIYAILPTGVAVFVKKEWVSILINKKELEVMPSKKAKPDTQPTVAVEKPAKAKAPKVEKPLSQRAAIKAAAERGEVPAAPDFSAPTHARFRKKLSELEALVKAGDVEGVRAFPIEPKSSSRKAIWNYRNLALVALEATAKA